MQDSTAVIASPPRKPPTSACPAWVSRVLIPPRLMIVAARTKNGTATSGKLFSAFASVSGTWVSGTVVK